MKKLMMFAMMMAFLAPFLLGISGCAGPKHQGGSTYEKSKSDYENSRREGSGGY
ncbi:MAG: hypothetical protein IID17_09635 [Nitrospinae bacterium]|nr:hypothetical protein [Nitrospinota bacterium]